MYKVHQNIVIDGIDYGDRGSRKYSAFCNEGKWNNFILPFLPEDPKEMVFVEYGSNAGLYLKMAKEYGFDRVVGFESDIQAYHMAEIYKKSLKMNYTTLHDTFTEDFNFNTLPVADITLLANFHYHLTIPEFTYLFDNLKYKTCYLLIVSCEDAQVVHWRQPRDINGIRQCLQEWEEIGCIAPQVENDPHPRKMFSVLFKSNLKRQKLTNLIDRTKKPIQLGNAFGEFITLSTNGKNFDITDTLHYKKIYYQKEKKWSKEKIDEFVMHERDLIRDMYKNGIKKPVLIDKNNIILDGDHRINFLQAFGYTSIIKRKLENYIYG